MACPMPQEMRRFDKKTETSIPEVEKLMSLHLYLGLPSVQRKGPVFQDIVVQSIWPEMNIIDAGLVRDGLLYLDSLQDQPIWLPFFRTQVPYQPLH